MNSNNGPSWTAAVIGFLSILAGAFFVSDYAFGPQELAETQVAGKIYVHSYTTTRTEFRTHHVGKSTFVTPHTYTVYHPEQFYLLSLEGDRYSVTALAYEQAQRGQPLILGRHVGRWSGWHYFWNLVAVSPRPEHS